MDQGDAGVGVRPEISGFCCRLKNYLNFVEAETLEFIITENLRRSSTGLTFKFETTYVNINEMTSKYKS